MSYERGSLMLAHSALIGAVIYLVMRYFFNQPALVAEDRSIAIAAIVLIYMVMFGIGSILPFSAMTTAIEFFNKHVSEFEL